MSPLHQSSTRNRLLAALSPDDFFLLQPHLEPVTFGLRQVVVKAGEAISHVDFVERGQISILAQIEHGRIEVGMVGPEGITGTPLVLEASISPYTFMSQAESDVLRIPAEVLQAALSWSGTLRTILLHYVHALMTQMAQTAFANASYDIEARLARWILMMHDRLGTDDLPMTHDFLSAMLGNRRSSVTTATHVLEGNGLIRARRGIITVRDRERLEELAGDAYGLAEREYERLFGSGRA